MNKVLKIILSVLVLLVSTSGYSQIDSPNMSHLTCDSLLSPEDTLGVYTFTDQKAEFPGGETKLSHFLTSNLDLPKKINNEHGLYYAHFTIDTLGRVGNVCILRPLNPYPYGEAIVNRIKEMPKWKPAVDGNKKVPVRIYFPLRFCIAYNTTIK